MKRTTQQANAEARMISEGMRAIDPEGFDAARASVRRNMATAKRFTPWLLRQTKLDN